MQRYDQVVSEIRRPTAVEMMEREVMEARLAENIEDMPVKVNSPQKAGPEPEEGIPTKEFTPSPLTQRLRVTSAADEPLRQRTIVKVPNLGFEPNQNAKDERTEWKSRYARRLRRIDQLRLRTLSANRDASHTEDEYAAYQEWKQRIKSDAGDKKTRIFESQREGSWTAEAGAEAQEVADKVAMETPGVAEEDVRRTEQEEQEQASGVSEEDSSSGDGGKDVEGPDGGKK